MKIALVISMFPPEWLAGSEIAAYNTAKYLAARGHDVHVITSMDCGLLEESIEDGFHIHRLKYPRIGLLLSAGFFALATLRALKRINPDVVHAQGVYYSVAAYLFKRLREKPYIIYFRGTGLYMPHYIVKTILKLSVINAAEVLALTEHMRTTIEAKYKRDAIVIPNGVDTSRFSRLSKKAARAELNIKEGEQVVIFVGSLISVKGVEYLVEAKNTAIQHFPEARLLLVGDGEGRQKLEALVTKLNLEKGVSFVGKVAYERVPGYLVASDLFVLPSLSEGFPNVVLEAMAAGLPVVTTNVRGLPEIVKDGENGFVVEPQNPRQLVEKIALLLDNNELRQKISANNKRKAEQYSWEAVVDRLEKVYFSCSNQTLP